MRDVRYQCLITLWAFLPDYPRVYVQALAFVTSGAYASFRIYLVCVWRISSIFVAAAQGSCIGSLLCYEKSRLADFEDHL